jgi:thiol-disulfide isomerase/thioredoxin
MKLKFAGIFLILTGFVNISCSQKDYNSASDFPSNAEWLNTDMPISLKALRGKLVLLDFWTYACINCMHIIPDLKKLEQKYKNELVVIGVHSAKFLTERGTENIRQAILRYEIEHPVINDRDLVVWDSYDANAWPTLVLIDPNGKIISRKSGEGVYDFFDPVISDAVKEYDIDPRSVRFARLEKDKAPKSILSFPGKIAADPKTMRLFLTDSNNNRILILKISPLSFGETSVGEVLDVIGSGKIGRRDGSFLEAEFFRPQGVALADDVLYVADTENHLIRKIDLESKQVSTIAGTGEQSGEFGIVHGNADETALNSPWDLVLVDNALYIAMAGDHQLWKLDLAANKIGTYAGSGKENIVDGNLRDAALAQPSGITTDGMKLYFADSEVSGIRSADLNPSGRVQTIIGKGLFDFGDIDGIGSKVRLQHPLGIVYNLDDGLLYVADTYNNKIKVVNPKTKESKTLSGTGVEGYRDGVAAQFNEPGGLTIMNGFLYITDTNNHLLRALNLKTGEVKTVAIKNPSKLLTESRRKSEVITLESKELKSRSSVKFNFTLPEHFKINPDALPQISVSSDNGIISEFEKEIVAESASFVVPLVFDSLLEAGKGSVNSGKLNIRLLIYYCETENIGICKFKDLLFEVPVFVVPNGTDVIQIDYSLN